MKGHKLAGETAHAYHIQHPDGSHFKVAKGPLTSKMHAVIKKMPKAEHFVEGGMAGFGGLGSNVGLESAPTAEAGGPGDLGDAVDTFMSKSQAGLPSNKVTEGTGPVANPDQYAGLMAPEQTEGAPLASAANDPAPGPSVPETPQPFSLLDQPSPDAAQGGPQPQPEQAPQNPILAGFQNAINGQTAANNNMAAAQGKASDDRASLLQQQINDQAVQQVYYNQRKASVDAETARLQADVEASRINPNRYFENMSTGGKVLAIIASAIGGGGAALAGQPNLAAQAIQEAIKRDIQAQVQDLDTKKGLLRTNLEISHDLDTAKAMTFNQMMAVTQAKLNQSAAANGSAIAKAQAGVLNANLAAASEPVRAQIANMQAQQDFMRSAQQAGNQMAGGGGRGGFNNDRYNALATIHPELRKDLDAERKQFENDRRVISDAEHIFKVAPTLTSYADRLTPGLPNITEKTKQYHAIVDPFLDSLTKDTSGRVTPETVHLIRQAMPVAGDSASTIATKQNAVIDMLKKSASYPLMQQYGIVAPVQSSGEVAGKYK